jgi:phosphoenolpyruvate carboxykinase (GTP)
MNQPVMQGLRLNLPAYVKHARLIAWVAEIAALTEAADIYWCDGSSGEYQSLCNQLQAAQPGTAPGQLPRHLRPQ